MARIKKPFPVERCTSAVVIWSINSHYNGFGLCSSVFCCCWFHVFSVLFNITNENGPTGTKRRVRASVLGTAALFTQQLYIETEFARNTQTFEKLEHFSDHHVLGRMDITRFQTVSGGDFRIALYLNIFLILLKHIPCEWYHSIEALKRLMQSLASFLLCDVLGAKTSRLPDSQ